MAQPKCKPSFPYETVLRLKVRVKNPQPGQPQWENITVPGTWQDAQTFERKQDGQIFMTLPKAEEATEVHRTSIRLQAAAGRIEGYYVERPIKRNSASGWIVTLESVEDWKQYRREPQRGSPKREPKGDSQWTWMTAREIAEKEAGPEEWDGPPEWAALDAKKRESRLRSHRHTMTRKVRKFISYYRRLKDAEDPTQEALPTRDRPVFDNRHRTVPEYPYERYRACRDGQQKRHLGPRKWSDPGAVKKALVEYLQKAGEPKPLRDVLAAARRLGIDRRRARAAIGDGDTQLVLKKGLCLLVPGAHYVALPDQRNPQAQSESLALARELLASGRVQVTKAMHKANLRNVAPLQLYLAAIQLGAVLRREGEGGKWYLSLPAGAHSQNTAPGSAADHASAPPAVPAAPQPDGPIPPDKLRVGGQVYDGFTKSEMRLLECLWGKPAVAYDKVIEDLYGHSAGDRQVAYLGVRARLVRKLADKNCPIDIRRRTGAITLQVSIPIET